MNDLIDRQAAIDAIEEVDWFHQNKNKDMVSGANPSEHQAWYKADDIYKTLEALPSAQPEPPTDDCISRKAAITLPVMPKEHREYQTINLDDAYEQGWNDLQKCIESLPFAQPDVQPVLHGHWNWLDGVHCSCMQLQITEYSHSKLLPEPYFILLILAK